MIYNSSPLVCTVNSAGQTFYLSAGSVVFVKASVETGSVTIAAVASTTSATSGTLYVTQVFLNDNPPNLQISSTNNISVSGGTMDVNLVGFTIAALPVDGTVNTNIINASTKKSIDISDSVAPSDTPVVSISSFAIGFTPILNTIPTAIIINDGQFIQTGSVAGQVGLSTAANVNGLFKIGNAVADNPWNPWGKGIWIASGSTVYLYCSSAMSGILVFNYTTL